VDLPKPQGREAKCDACGRVAFCIQLPLRGSARGTLCLACLSRTLRDLQREARS